MTEVLTALVSCIPHACARAVTSSAKREYISYSIPATLTVAYDMRIQILSDLHLEMERQGSAPGCEFCHYEIPVCAENLALLGDIGWTMDDRLFEWLEAQLKLFKTIYFVSGNHEPYRSSIVRLFYYAEDVRSLADLNKLPVEICRMNAYQDWKCLPATVNANPTLGNLVFLNRTRHDISPQLTILGCTLWSALHPDDLDILSWSLTDFRRIESFDPAAFVSLHQADLAWLKSTVSAIAEEAPERKIVVFTHHAPTLDGTGDPRVMNGPTNSAFATELTGETCWTSKKIALWAFGHTHWCCDFERRGVRVYSNQRGYGEGKGYSVDKVIEL